MKRIRLWLPVLIVVVGVGVYLAVTNLGPDRKQPEKKPEKSPEPQITETSEKAPPAESAPKQPTPEEADTAEATTKPDAGEKKQTLVIGGTVVDEKKAPVAAAEVILLPAPYADATARTTRTDDAGRFRFEDAPGTAA